jgi:DNA replicative helicase MCM subunit Mcm2 (Cdc46/Mcm family)
MSGCLAGSKNRIGSFIRNSLSRLYRPFFTFGPSLQIVPEVHVRVVNLPISDRLRDLRQGDLNNLIKVSGVVTRRTSIFPMLQYAAYECNERGCKIGPEYKFTPSTPPVTCPICMSPEGPFKMDAQRSQYGNFQKLTLQESPGSVPAGRVPRYKDVILLGDLIDIARPGEEIEVTGVYMHSQQGLSKDRNGFPVFSTIIEANCIQRKSGTTNSGLSDEDKRAIRELSHDSRVSRIVTSSLCASGSRVGLYTCVVVGNVIRSSNGSFGPSRRRSMAIATSRRRWPCPCSVAALKKAAQEARIA